MILKGKKSTFATCKNTHTAQKKDITLFLKLLIIRGDEFVLPWIFLQIKSSLKTFVACLIIVLHIYGKFKFHVHRSEDIAFCWKRKCTKISISLKRGWAFCSLLVTFCLLLFVLYLLLFVRCSLLFACCSLLLVIARYFLLVACYFLLVNRCFFPAFMGNCPTISHKCYPHLEFFIFSFLLLLKEMRTRGESTILSCCFCVSCKWRGLGRRGSPRFPCVTQWWKVPETFFEL